MGHSFTVDNWFLQAKRGESPTTPTNVCNMSTDPCHRARTSCNDAMFFLWEKKSQVLPTFKDARSQKGMDTRGYNGDYIKNLPAEGREWKVGLIMPPGFSYSLIVNLKTDLCLIYLLTSVLHQHQLIYTTLVSHFIRNSGCIWRLNYCVTKLLSRNTETYKSWRLWPWQIESHHLSVEIIIMCLLVVSEV